MCDVGSILHTVTGGLVGTDPAKEARKAAEKERRRLEAKAEDDRVKSEAKRKKKAAQRPATDVIQGGAAGEQLGG
jgi:hypothetical protein